MNIYEKMAAITNELETIQKDLVIKPNSNSSYKAVSEAAILNAVKPLEKKHKIYSYPAKRKVLESNLIDNSTIFKEAKTGNETVTKKTSYMSRIETTYRFVNLENPDEFIEVTSLSEGLDTSDKGSGKAMSYGDKYALMKAYKIGTGDDVPPPIPKVSELQVRELEDILDKYNLSMDKMLGYYKVDDIYEMDIQQYGDYINQIKAKYPDFNMSNIPQSASRKEVEQLQAINSRVGVKK